MNYTVDNANCSLLPYAKNLFAIPVEENIFYCDKKIDPIGKLITFEYQVKESLQNIVKRLTLRTNFTKLPDMIFQEKTFLCENGTSAVITGDYNTVFPSKETCHFTTLKLNSNTELPICDHQNSGLNINGQVDIDQNALAKKLLNKQVIWLHGDSTSKNLVKSAATVLNKTRKESPFRPKILSGCLKRGENRNATGGSWTDPNLIKMEKLTFYRLAHGSPPLGNPNCNADYSVKRVLDAIEDLISTKPDDTTIIFAPGFHYTNWNPCIFAKDVSDINKHATELKERYPTLKILFRELPWSNIKSTHSRLMSTWIQRKQNAIVRKILDQSVIEIVNTFDYVFTRWKEMRFDNLHTDGIEDHNIAKMILDKI